MKTMEEKLQEYAGWLRYEEKSPATVEKYVHAVREFLTFVEDDELEKSLVIVYRERLRETHEPAGANAKLSAVNSYLKHIGRGDCTVKSIKVQKQIFAREERELSPKEYARLLHAAGNRRIYFIMRTICETGIRVSELQYITVEGVQRGKVRVDCKNKCRYVFISQVTCQMLLEYCEQNHIESGVIFQTRTGRPVDRKVVWREMKGLCRIAGVDEQKVFPHNLRHLFARIFYAKYKDLGHLSDVLGHASIQTTRLYIMETGIRHLEELEEVAYALSSLCV